MLDLLGFFKKPVVATPQTRQPTELLLAQLLREESIPQLALLLRQRKLLNASQLEAFLLLHANPTHSMSEHASLLTHFLWRYISDIPLVAAINDTLESPWIDLRSTLCSPNFHRQIPETIRGLYQFTVLNIDRTQKQLALILLNQDNATARRKISQWLTSAPEFGRDWQVRFFVADAVLLKALIEDDLSGRYQTDAMFERINRHGRLDDANWQGDNRQAPAVRISNAIIVEAAEMGASDIHLEPEDNHLRIRYRLDGRLLHIRTAPITIWKNLLIRYKVIGQMDIAESRLPQDGQVSLNLFGKSVDIRIATMPTTHGENCVLRLLDGNKQVLSLEHLGFAPPTKQAIEKLLTMPQGIFLISGATGSGKTTTLYALMLQLNEDHRNIMTLEDPVEYPLAGLRQSSIMVSGKFDYADGVRGLMRQDPDILLIGEMRDEKTAEMTYRAAMTGHQVFSTIHANSVFGVLPRLSDLGVAKELLAENTLAIAHQQLLRKLCPHCAQNDPAGTEWYLLLQRQRRSLGGLMPTNHGSASQSPQVKKAQLGVGAQACPHCFGEGYRGRVACMAFLWLDNEVQRWIAEGAPSPLIRERCEQQKIATGHYLPLADNLLWLLTAGVIAWEDALLAEPQLDQLIAPSNPILSKPSVSTQIVPRS